MMQALTARRLFTPLQEISDAVLLIEDGVIAAAGGGDSVRIPASAQLTEYGEAILAPGYVDMHIHGGAGFDLMSGTPEAYLRVSELLARHGVTSFVPTTVTAPEELTFRSLDALGRLLSRPDTGARGVGLHLEGPFLSHAKRGVHPPQDLREPSLDLFDRMWQACEGQVKVLTIAPELRNSSEVIKAASERGVCVSIGHSDATEAATRKGLDSGAIHATHTFNAMRALNHREPGILGVVLADDRVVADIICDGVHVSPAALKLFFKAKGEELAVLITDALSATGMGDGRYKLGDFEIEVRGLVCEHNGTLAGSVLTLDRAVLNAVQLGGVHLRQAVRMASYNPARQLGLWPRNGQLIPGADADINVLSSSGEVLATYIGGRLQGT